jgi:hypothetical protein
MDVQDILKQLEVNEGTFPREAVAQAIEQREAITPELLRILEYARENIEEIAERPDYFAHIYIEERDYSEDTGLPLTGIRRIVWVLTFEPGGQTDVRSRRVSTRPKRRHHVGRRPADARDRPVQSH